jgi:hypothetical protein
MNRRELLQGIVASAAAAMESPRIAFSSAADCTRSQLYLTPPMLAHLWQRFRSDADWTAQLMSDGDFAFHFWRYSRNCGCFLDLRLNAQNHAQSGTPYGHDSEFWQGRFRF